MKAICIEKDLKPENRVILNKYYERVPYLTGKPNIVKSLGVSHTFARGEVSLSEAGLG